MTFVGQIPIVCFPDVLSGRDDNRRRRTGFRFPFQYGNRFFFGNFESFVRHDAELRWGSRNRPPSLGRKPLVDGLVGF
jgi:hypothetical protein